MENKEKKDKKILRRTSKEERCRDIFVQIIGPVFFTVFSPILGRKPSRGLRKKTHGFYYLFSSLPPNQIPSKKFSFLIFSFFPSSLKSTLPNTPKINLHYIFQSYWNELLCIIFYMNLLVISFLLCTNHA